MLCRRANEVVEPSAQARVSLPETEAVVFVTQLLLCRAVAG